MDRIDSIHDSSATAPRDGAPRILFVDNDASDFLHYRIALARKLQELGFDVHVAVPPDSHVQALSQHGMPIHSIHMNRKGTHLVDELRCYVSLLRLYRRLRPLLVHHICLKPALYGGLAARVLGIPAVVHSLTGLGYPLTAYAPKMLLLRPLIAGGLRLSFGHRNNRVILQNRDDLARMLGSGTVSGDRAVLIRGSGVDLSQFTPAPEPNGAPVVLMACRLLWSKGVAEFVAAARALRTRGSAARFVLLGEPDPGHPSAVPLHTLERWREAGDVEWLGWRNDMPAWIARSHIVCLPSWYGEGIPRILVEAAACGRPAIATDSPGCREVVRHDENGLLVPCRDRDALVSAISELLENPARRAELGRRGRTIAVSEFSQERIIESNLAVYRSLVGAVVPLERRDDMAVSG